MTATWVFGYGSLVSPESLASTIGRRVVLGADVHPAVLGGFGRRWNYGSLTLRGWWERDGAAVHGVVVSLGVEASSHETCNGVIVAVSDDELARLDHRERDYERMDVTERVSTEHPVAAGVRIVTYVPRPSAVERYERARDLGRAAVRRSYWELVHGAFAEVGADALDRFRATTPHPLVPVVDVTLTP